MTGGVLAFSFPNPFKLLGALISPLLNLGADLMGSIVQTVIEGLASVVVGALVDLTSSVLGFFWDAAEPDLNSSWFYGADAPYWQMVLLAMPLLVVFFLAGVIQGALRGDTAGMLRMAFLRLPGSVLAMSVVVVFADVLVDVTDSMSDSLLDSFRDDVEQVGVVLGSLALGGSLPALMLILVFGGVGLIAAVVLVIELFVRAALLYLLAAFSPLIYAAAIWEPMRGSVRKLGEIALALIVSKLAISASLAVSSAALVSTWPGTEPTAIPTPESVAVQQQQPAGSVVGILVSAIVMWFVSAFMPFVLWRLLPLVEGAAVTQGVRGAPVRGAHMGASAAIMALNNPATVAVRGSGGGGRARGLQEAAAVAGAATVGAATGRSPAGKADAAGAGARGPSLRSSEPAGGRRRAAAGSGVPKGRGDDSASTSAHRGSGNRPKGQSPGAGDDQKHEGSRSRSHERPDNDAEPIADAWRRHEMGPEW